MVSSDWRLGAARQSLGRILVDIEDAYAESLAERPEAWSRFKKRLDLHWPRLFRNLHELYGWQYDFFYTLERLARSMVEYWLERPTELFALDERREAEPDWFLSQDVVGLVLYVDLFADKLAGLQNHLPYFKKLGLRYLHLMPLFASPKGDSDGGYAISDYRSINPDIGSMEDLREVARQLREENISLVLDFVFNHTSDEHTWAKRAREGDPAYRDYYLTFPDRELPDQYQEKLRDIFPTIRRGSFTWNEDMKRWVWTTFNSFQWDLNYANPEVLRAMVGEMLFLANQGVEVFRLDAVPFAWKKLGTTCENQPEAHTVVRVFNAILGIVAPSVLLKSEAIVHPDEVIRYVDKHECQLSYNPLKMALLWEALATREVKLLEHSMRYRHRLPRGCSWVNYLRCHDDIGWSFDDDDARQVGIDPVGHRQFLNAFYLGKHPGSFARGVPFQENPDTGDARVSGTLSSLAGLEQAVELQDDALIELAVKRISMLWSIQVSVGGIPLLYAGDEFGQMNDYTYLHDPQRVNDSRWVHRAKRRWEAQEDLADQNTLEWRFFREKTRLFRLRKQIPAFYNGG
ncbi:MAG: alpha-amylase family protein, partial [Myxococcota bacterium]